MELKSNGKYDLVVVSSMGVRITPADRQPVSMSRLYEMQATSAESNVGNISASLGKRVKVLTKFVKDSAIAEFIKAELRRRNLEYEGLEIPQGGPFGCRHQFNIADSGYGRRRPVVQNDRAGEVACTLSAQDFDLERIFHEEGCRILHFSGLIASLSKESGRCCLEIARMAKKYGTVISFDMNYRASFWKGREEELRPVFQELAGLSDILIGNEEDFQLALGIQGPEAGGLDVSGKIDGFKEMIGRIRENYPGASVFATTLRTVIDANSHQWGAILYAKDQWFVEEQREIAVYDRIGGGDGFVGGMLYAILSGYPPAEWIRYGWACGALVATLATDYGQPVSEEEIRSIYEGNARVKR
ncbi:PfkB family carbohydrate kinase [Diplocloster modestus]|uniref:Sugar kinase n=1 Tax=Diplocloster modestus TaxID=2850322 RepID=A0ABS6K9X0_9FIRM|nr:PfkB family carbohydrate kinase [Diplocloster modestus]MBU9727290.1 sugar kinase [Diplocloster modestus]